MLYVLISHSRSILESSIETYLNIPGSNYLSDEASNRTSYLPRRIGFSLTLLLKEDITIWIAGFFFMKEDVWILLKDEGFIATVEAS